jgi:hypothetical protein
MKCTPENTTRKAQVFLNGNRIGHVFCANPKNGTVRVLREPLKVHKHRKRVIQKTLHGVVEVWQ